jgi:2-polyprenyl-3-methyl-5-hydroxy-6-metoxy-1,4-benzoquinol methylase
MAQEQGLVALILRDRILNVGAVDEGSDNVYRAVQGEGYAENFGLQWSLFSHTQFDDEVGSPLSRDRLLQTSGWTAESFEGELVLEVGAGAGRFTREMLRMGAKVVAVDLSSAIDVNVRENGALGELVGVQASVYDIPVAPSTFSRVLCLGVLQHTPNPQEALQCLWALVAPGGELVLDVYAVARRPSPYFLPKYVWRPLTRRMKPETLLKVVRWYVPKYLPFDTKLKSLHGGTEVSGLLPIPCFNHVSLPLTEEQRLEWAILDTFDALGARFDRPSTLASLRRQIEALADVKDYRLVRGHSARIFKQ